MSQNNQDSNQKNNQNSNQIYKNSNSNNNDNDNNNDNENDNNIRDINEEDSLIPGIPNIITYLSIGIGVILTFFALAYTSLLLFPGNPLGKLVMNLYKGLSYAKKAQKVKSVFKSNSKSKSKNKSKTKNQNKK